MIAERAICLPKLDDTFLTPGATAFTFVVRSSWSLFCCCVVSFLRRIWKLEYSSPFVDLPRPCTTASFRPIASVC